jgi:hypothetical protein
VPRLNHDNADDLAVLQQARPYIRSTLAFLLYLRNGIGSDLGEIYSIADQFIEVLEHDMENP